MTTPRSALFQPAAIALALGVFPAAAPVAAQEEATPFGAISCSSNYGHPALLDKKLIHLVVAPAAEIASLPKNKPALSAGPFAGGKFPYDTAPSFHVELLESFPNVSLRQVAAKQGTLHELVWLAAGFNAGTGRYVFSAVRMAPEFGTSAACGTTRSEPFAASIERKKGTLDAILDVEPAHQYDADGKRVDSGDPGQHTTPCPVKLRMFGTPALVSCGKKSIRIALPRRALAT